MTPAQCAYRDRLVRAHPSDSGLGRRIAAVRAAYRDRLARPANSGLAARLAAAEAERKAAA